MDLLFINFIMQRVSKKNIWLLTSDIRHPDHLRKFQKGESLVIAACINLARQTEQTAMIEPTIMPTLEFHIPRFKLLKTSLVSDLFQKNIDSLMPLSAIVPRKSGVTTPPKYIEQQTQEKSKPKILLEWLQKQNKAAIISILALILVAAGFYSYIAAKNKYNFLRSSLDEQRQSIQNHFLKGGRAFENLDYFTSRQEFIAAAGNLADIRSKYLSGFAGIFLSFGKLFSNKVKDGLSLVTMGEKAALAAANLAEQADKIDLVIKGVFKNIFPNASAEPTNKPQGQTPIEFLQQARKNLATILDASRMLFTSSFFKSGDSNFTTVEDNLLKAQDSLDLLTSLLGASEPKTYLLLFQNETEARGTGGFLGSFGLIRFNKAEVEAFRIHDTYDFDGQLNQIITPPPPLQDVTPTWGLRDANWFFDFPTSAKKASEFFSDSKLADVPIDGVIAIDLSFIKKLLELVGPIDIPEYNMTITDQDFIAQIQEEVESGADKAKNQPKKILIYFGPALFKKLATLDQGRRQALQAILSSSLEQKDIMFYSADPKTEKLIAEHGWGGEIKNTNADYLAIDNSNIKGGKSDYAIKQSTDLSVVPDSSGKNINTLTITRAHNGYQESLRLWRAVNYDYMRIYLPLGSRVLKASGFKTNPFTKKTVPDNAQNDSEVDIIFSTARVLPQYNLETYIESGKTVIAGWVTTWPGSKSKISLMYTAPLQFKSDGSDYKILIQKQAGIISDFSFSFADKNKKEFQLAKDMELEPNN